MKRINFAAEVSGIWRAATGHPVELIVLLHAMMSVIVEKTVWWVAPTAYAPFAVVAALCLWFHRSRRWARWSYWAVLPLYVLAMFLPAEWHRTPEMGILYALLAPSYLLVRGGDFNRLFFSMVRSLAVSFGIGVLTCLLLLLIKESVFTLFDIRRVFMETELMSFSLVLLSPMVFIGMESSAGELRASRLEEALVNWVLTIALLIYNVVLYVYMVRILAQWELPKGSVATMVAVFMVALMGVRWLRPMLSRQPLECYFRWSGLLALPLLALFWVAVGYRIGQYGLTIDRCMLIASGLSMTVYVVVSPFKTRWSGYGFMALTVVVGLLLVLTARPMSMHSQTTVVRHYAEKAGVLADDGTLRFGPRCEADSAYRAEHRHVYKALEYMERDLHDTVAVRQRFGMTSEEYLKLLSPETYKYAKAWSVECYDKYPEELDVEKGFYVRSNNEGVILNPGNYIRMYTNIEFHDRKIILGGNIIPADSVLAVQLADIGYTLESDLDEKRIDAYEEQLCTYRSPDGRMLLVFRRFYISRDNDGNHMDYGTINCALVN